MYLWRRLTFTPAYFLISHQRASMKVILLIIFCITTLLLVAQSNDSSITFTPHLDWRFFKGVPNNDTSAAVISTTISVAVERVSIWNGKITFKACAIMHPSKSWVRPGYAVEYVLQHEQTHFNITAIHAWKLQEALNNKKIYSQSSPLINSFIHKWQKEMVYMQDQYDRETKNGQDSTVQNIWNKKVLTELNKTALSNQAQNGPQRNQPLHKGSVYK